MANGRPSGTATIMSATDVLKWFMNSWSVSIEISCLLRSMMLRNIWMTNTPNTIELTIYPIFSIYAAIFLNFFYVGVGTSNVNDSPYYPKHVLFPTAQITASPKPPLITDPANKKGFGFLCRLESVRTCFLTRLNLSLNKDSSTITWYPSKRIQSAGTFCPTDKDITSPTRSSCCSAVYVKPPRPLNTCTTWWRYSITILWNLFSLDVLQIVFTAQMSNIDT